MEPAAGCMHALNIYIYICSQTPKGTMVRSHFCHSPRRLSPAMKAFIRKSKDKNKNLSSRVADVAPTLSLPMVSISDDDPVFSSSQPTLTAPSVTSFSSEAFSHSTNAPLYARFARGSSALDFNDASSLTPPVSPPHTLRHRASTDSAKGVGGSGFRSSGVRDEVDRLAVTKRERSEKPRSIRSVSGDSDEPLPVLTALPRPPTPPPPSPPKLVYAKYSPLPSSPAKEASSPSKSPAIVTPPVRSTSPSVLTPPASPSGTRRGYSPLAAFYSKPPQADTNKSSLSPTPLDTTSLNAPAPPLSPNLPPSISTPTTPIAARNSPAYGPGMASMLRAATRNGRPTSPISSNGANGTPPAPSPANVTTSATEPIIGSYFSKYSEMGQQVNQRDGRGNVSVTMLLIWVSY